MAEDKTTARKALVFLRDGRVRVADAEDINVLAHAVEIRLRRSDPTDRTQDVDVFPWGEVARVYIGMAEMRQGQWVAGIDAADKTWQRGDLA
jgi:nitrogen fixation protein FixH